MKMMKYPNVKNEINPTQSQPSSPGGPLYDCDGFMAATYNFGDPGTSATGDV